MDNSNPFDRTQDINARPLGLGHNPYGSVQPTLSNTDGLRSALNAFFDEVHSARNPASAPFGETHGPQKPPSLF